MPTYDVRYQEIRYYTTRVAAGSVGEAIKMVNENQDFYPNEDIDTVSLGVHRTGLTAAKLSDQVNNL